MQQIAPFLLIGLVFALIGVGIYGVILSARKRREAWQREGQRLGLMYARNNTGMLSEFGHFKLFGRGRYKKVPSSISGTLNGIRVVVGDYQYTTGSGKNSSTHVQTVCCLKDARLNAPHCFVRREAKFFDFLGKVFGGKDINYDEDPEFSKAFVLQGHSEADTRAWFTAEVRRYFMHYAGTNIQFEMIGDSLVFHRGVRIKKPEADVQALIDESFGFLNLFVSAADPMAGLSGNMGGGDLEGWSV